MPKNLQKTSKNVEKITFCVKTVTKIIQNCEKGYIFPGRESGFAATRPPRFHRRLPSLPTTESTGQRTAKSKRLRLISSATVDRNEFSKTRGHQIRRYHFLNQRKVFFGIATRFEFTVADPPLVASIAVWSTRTLHWEVQEVLWDLGMGCKLGLPAGRVPMG